MSDAPPAPDSSPQDELGPDSSALDQYLGGALAGKGYAFEAAGQKYGVDPTLLASIATLESGHGNSHATKAFNNPMGRMDPKSPNQTGFIKYNSLDDGIDAAASDLSRNYIQKGLTTIPQIGQEYSPPPKGGKPASNDPYNTNKGWPSQVQQIYTKMGGDKTDFGSDDTASSEDSDQGYGQSFDRHLGGPLGAVNA